ncbi:hypothetical protein Z959_13220 [Clostridium novyi B str. ATCC 27606]|uniref:HTH cro/C1-type domain-containing protein n=1 Tax=Clostridium novyi B str. ATCC 27606 TaxID=1443123 RepID=A0AA40IRR3_CLONO|nr:MULTISPECIES: helix-turn-helix transcriptional regulator [Clostridium]KEI11820.1 hypothetical protein Z959_13220 [Clostridium novyi B str. ATCC 27606]CAG7839560.1 hypothetical protein CLOHAE12215_00973 [Clostridium haemolyticum]
MIKVKILDLIKEKGVSLRSVAIKTGMSYSALHRLAHSKTYSISYATIIQLCKFFNCRIEDIIEYVDIN